jgi:hypothetical protein
LVVAPGLGEFVPRQPASWRWDTHVAA